MALRFRIRTTWDELLASLWFRPTVLTVMISLLALVSLVVDQRLGMRDLPFLNPGVDDARAILSSITSSMLTVTTVTFSILMVALVLASQQFSPRIIRNFQRDPALQYVLGIFIGTFIFGLLVLGRVSDARDIIFVPTFSLLISIILSVLSIAAFIYFIHHIADIIHVNTIISTVSERTVAILDQRFPMTIGHGRELAVKLPEQPAEVILSQSVGYIQGIDPDVLFALAVRHDLIIKLDRNVSDYVPEGTALMHVWGVMTSLLADELRSTVDIGNERTLFQDVLFGIRQLVDVAIKALSPAVNDPTTATNCIDYLGNILVQAARKPDPLNTRYDDQQCLRIVARGVPFERIVAAAFTQIRVYGAGDIFVLLHILEALIEIAEATRDPERLTVIWRQARILSRAAAEKINEPSDRVHYNSTLLMLAACVGRAPDAALLPIDESVLVDDAPLHPTNVQ